MTNQAVLDGVFETICVARRQGFLAHSPCVVANSAAHDGGIRLQSPHDRWEDNARSSLACEAHLAQCGPHVNDDRRRQLEKYALTTVHRQLRCRAVGAEPRVLCHEQRQDLC